MKIGVIIGRFQVDDLHEGHKALIKFVADENDKVLFLLGDTSAKNTMKDPLDFSVRSAMVENFFKTLETKANYSIFALRDCKENEIWSQNLDNLLKTNFSDTDEVVLYGSRDSFYSSYSGIYPYKQFKYQKEEVNASSIRNMISLIKPEEMDSSFRKGIIFSVYNKRPIVYPTVDIALTRKDESNSTEILVGKKPFETKIRLPGGFVDPTESTKNSLFSAGKRELEEECGKLETSKPKFVNSFMVDDWRYKGREDKIMTSLIQMEYLSGEPVAGDDLAEVKWVKLFDIKQEEIVSEHWALIEELKQFILDNL